MEYWNAIWQSVLLGTVQGLTEFLPVSSSGHLTLLQIILGKFGYGLGADMLFVDVMLHFGTLIAVIVAFRKEIIALFRPPFKTLLMLVVATIPAGIVGVLWNGEIGELFNGQRALSYLSLCFLITAALLLFGEIMASRWKTPKPLGWRHALPMGVLQAVALFPGISRSGSTIAAGTVSGAKREDVATFSFLMSLPIILGSTAMEVLDFVKEPPQIGSVGPLAVGILLGVIVSALCGFFAIKWMMRIIRRANYKWFAFYLILLSMTSLWLDALGLFA